MLVNGAPGVGSFDAQGAPRSVAGFIVRGGRIVQITVLADPERLRRLDLAGWNG